MSGMYFFIFASCEPLNMLNGSRNEIKLKASNHTIRTKQKEFVSFKIELNSKKRKLLLLRNCYIALCVNNFFYLQLPQEYCTSNQRFSNEEEEEIEEKKKMSRWWWIRRWRRKRGGRRRKREGRSRRKGRWENNDEVEDDEEEKE